MGIKKVQLALNDYMGNKLKRDMAKINPLTKEPPRVMVVYDKRTCKKDYGRQVVIAIVLTRISDRGV